MLSQGSYSWHANMAHRARSDFGRARLRALATRFLSAFTGQASCLRSFNKAQSEMPVRGHLDRGLRDVPLSSIVGSVGRYQDFDRYFNPLRANTRSRWERLDLAALAGDYLPPVELYLIGGEYYVNDGNHRVSVAKHRGFDTIEAVVVEYVTDPVFSGSLPLEPVAACTLQTT